MPTREKLKELCIRYTKKYKECLKDDSFDVKETMYYLSLWKEVKAKNYNFGTLTSEAKDEVAEAVIEDECDNDCDNCVINEEEEDDQDPEDHSV